MLKIKVVNKGHQPLPQYATKQSAGMDLRANLDAPVTLKPLERRLIPTGLHIALPVGFEAQVRPRSGLALKKNQVKQARLLHSHHSTTNKVVLLFMQTG